MTIFTWYPDPVPDSMPVRQVYGFCFDAGGRLLMRLDGTKHTLPGGRPETGEDLAATLARECLEEVQVIVEQPIYLGYQRVDDEDGQVPYAQVRMVAFIAEIRDARPDPDTGRTYGRLLTSAAKAGVLLNWGDLGSEQTAAAAAAAITSYGIPAHAPVSDRHV